MSDMSCLVHHVLISRTGQTSKTPLDFEGLVGEGGRRVNDLRGGHNEAVRCATSTRFELIEPPETSVPPYIMLNLGRGISGHEMPP